MIDTSEPAFPRPVSTYPNGEPAYDSVGMTIRDYFAGQVLLGLLANANRRDGWRGDLSTRAEWIESEVETAYHFADEMLSRRVK
jgi:hypothetical protein